MFRRSLAVLSLSALLASAAGCAGGGGGGSIDANRRISQLEETIAKKDNELAAQLSTINELNKQLLAARQIKPERLDKLFYPERLEFDKLTGGEDYDNQLGDDGVTVYLKPVDRDGDVIKVAGDIRIELFDLAQTGDNVVGRYEVGVDDVRKLWYGKFMTQHYTIRCPWLKGPPAHNEITVRATFRDYLTQRVVTAQTVVTVRLAQAPAVQPAGRPAP